MKTIAEKELAKATNKFYEWSRKARTAAENYLKEVLEKQPDKRIDFDTEYDDESISIIYDGGNHPEYASNVCSSVSSVFMDEESKDIILSIEDSPMYGIDRVDALDLLTVCEAVQSHLANAK